MEFSITGLVFDKVALQIYPVPASTSLTIEVGVNPSELEFSVFDLKGAQMHLNSSVTSKRIVLDITTYKKRIYILNAKYKDRVKSVKFIKS